MAPIANVRDNNSNSNSNSDSGSNSRGSHLRRSISHPRSESIRTVGRGTDGVAWSRVESGEWTSSRLSSLSRLPLLKVREYAQQYNKQMRDGGQER
ncbi:GD14301 [Drosophila simulans]|uniref:GD14301 n=1 Tax=Drosophila simulans TaxID=7240 RepID=B4QQ51_DROSI|nr:GD14301 [Drosophila simulans]